jgi:hypothetical protein
LWIAWEEGPEKWASDSAEGGLRARRDIGIACLKDGKLYRATESEAALQKLGGEKGLQAPSIAFGGDNQLRLFFRQPVNVNWLEWDRMDEAGEASVQRRAHRPEDCHRARWPRVCRFLPGRIFA